MTERTLVEGIAEWMPPEQAALFRVWAAGLEMSDNARVAELEERLARLEAAGKTLLTAAAGPATIKPLGGPK